MSVFDLLSGGLSLSSPAASDAGNWAPVVSNSTTGEFNFGFGAKQEGFQLSPEILAMAGLFAWLILSKR